jgi:hypothetical protein
MDNPANPTGTQRPEYIVPALIAGLAAGVLSGIPFVNCLCCLWIIGGGVLAVRLLADRTPGNLTGGDGALVGALAGIVGALARGFMDILMKPVNDALVRRMQDSLPQLSNQMPAWLPSWLKDVVERGTPRGFSLGLFFLNLFVTAAIFAVLGILGGVIGASVFGRKKTPAPPPAQTPQPPQGPPDAAV